MWRYGVTWPPPNPLWPNFSFFFVVSVPDDLSACQIWRFLLKPLEPPVLNMHTKFEVSSSNRSRDMDWFKNSKSRSRDNFQTPFDLIFNFHRECLRWSIWVPNLKLLTQSVLEIWRVPKFEKYVTWPVPDPHGPNFSLSWLQPLVINLHAKFEVSSSNRSRDKEASQNFKSR